MKTYTLTITLTEEQHKMFVQQLLASAGETKQEAPHDQTEHKHKNVARLNSPSFKGYRIAVQRKGFNFVRYFPLGKSAKWHEAEQDALAERDYLLDILEGKSEAEVYKIFREYRQAIHQA